MNSPIGPAASILGEEYKGSSGGWIQTEYSSLCKDGSTITFLTTLPNLKKNEILYKENELGCIYCIKAPRVSYGIKPSINQIKNIKSIIDKINPDIIHLWGTETWLSNAVACVETNAKKIIYIQGLIGVHERYLGGYFNYNKNLKCYKKGASIISRTKNRLRTILFRRQANIEKDTILKCNNIIGDSDFTKAYCMSLSKDIKFYKHVLLPNEIFYKFKWNYAECNKNTIFTIYGSSSEKGTQNLLLAVSILKKQIPDIKVIIPGKYNVDSEGNILSNNKDEFQHILYNMINDLDIKKNIIFTGQLTPKEMAVKMSKCHIFVNTSCMEVHALSLREALIIGIPCISSHCGSVDEYVKHYFNGLLYRYEEYEVLAYYIALLLKNKGLAIKLSSNTSTSFEHIKIKNMSILEIYNILLNK